ncbi:Cytochrome P450 [Coniochaeta hoffmannii]|uniref:Cytochrome P450 n=1 Tax=Coniochaeta hoffmannii TaxID=91930 RepID=A0AA38RCI4_9PEZI|nr:Cytochrome P450 [Coniochaeta hoffmannii]
MDVATELLFGESTNGLLAGRAEPYGQRVLTGFAESVQYAQDKMAMHMALGWWASLKPDRQFRRDVQVVHRFIDGFVEKALREHRADIKRESYVLLHALVDTVKDPVQIRDELITILIAGRDTTASLISNMFFLLARRPDIWEKLREDVQRQFQDRLPTFEEIPQCKYVRYTINESLRLYPPVPLNSRVAVRDTVIPRGGGPEGKSPILVKEGMPIVYNVSGLHRRNDIYGKDVEEFRPERWEFLRVGWEFLPFSGGPRICIGQQFAVTEASYVLIRFLQSFESIQCTDPRPWQEKVSLTFSSLNGVRVSFKRGS